MLTIFAKHFIFDIWQGSEYGSMIENVLTFKMTSNSTNEIVSFMFPQKIFFQGI